MIRELIIELNRKYTIIFINAEIAFDQKPQHPFQIKALKKIGIDIILYYIINVYIYIYVYMCTTYTRCAHTCMLHGEIRHLPTKNKLAHYLTAI